jgi:hypothetical protein
MRVLKACIITQKEVMYTWKPWNNSNAWKKLYQIRITFMKKLREDGIQGMLAILRCSIFVSQFATENINIKINKTVIVYVLIWA